MAKAINWPLAFRDEVIGEDSETLHCAFRLGSLYYENRYWVPDEVVDIRVNHKKIRKAVVVGDLKQCPIAALTDEQLRLQKTTLRTKDALIRFLSETYNQPVDEKTLVTIVTYRNQPIVTDEMEQQDDPHM